MTLTESIKILGLSKCFSKDEVVTAYRKMAMKLHPDRNPHPKAADMFSMLGQAYQIALKSLDATNAMFALGNHFPSKEVVNIVLAESFTGTVVTLKSGQRIKLPSGIKDKAVMQASPRDVFTVSVAKDKKFKRVKDDAVVMVSITVFEALFGVTVEVTHLDGSKVATQIPAGVQCGDSVIIKQQGFSNTNTKALGDLVVVVLVVVPDDVSAEQLAIISKHFNIRSQLNI